MTPILIASALAAAGVPAHSVDIVHNEVKYDVDYRAVVKTHTRTLMAGAPSRPHSRQCLVTATVAIERAISGPRSAAALTSAVGPTRTFEKRSHGYCTRAEERGAELARAKSDKISGFLAATAEADRPAALAAIEAARTLAVN